MSKITAPRDMATEQLLAHEEMMQILDSDPRTAGDAPRPPRLVARVLDDWKAHNHAGMVQVLKADATVCRVACRRCRFEASR